MAKSTGVRTKENRPHRKRKDETVILLDKVEYVKQLKELKALINAKDFPIAIKHIDHLMRGVLNRPFYSPCSLKKSITVHPVPCAGKIDPALQKDKVIDIIKQLYKNLFLGS